MIYVTNYTIIDHIVNVQKVKSVTYRQPRIEKLGTLSSEYLSETAHENLLFILAKKTEKQDIVLLMVDFYTKDDYIKYLGYYLRYVCIMRLDPTKVEEEINTNNIDINNPPFITAFRKFPGRFKEYISFKVARFLFDKNPGTMEWVIRFDMTNKDFIDLLLYTDDTLIVLKQLLSSRGYGLCPGPMLYLKEKFIAIIEYGDMKLVREILSIVEKNGNTMNARLCLATAQL